MTLQKQREESARRMVADQRSFFEWFVGEYLFVDPKYALEQLTRKAALYFPEIKRSLMRQEVTE